MPITTKKKAIRTTKTSGSKSKTPRIVPSDIGMTDDELLELHESIEAAKIAKGEVDGSEIKQQLLENARKRIFGGLPGAFNVELPDGCILQVKPSTRAYALNEAQIVEIENIFDGTGHDSGDYYHESHGIELKADIIHERLEAEKEDKYFEFQAALGDFMNKWGVSDCWEMKETIIARDDFAEKRMNLGKSINLKLEKVKPSTIAIGAQREI